MQYKHCTNVPRFSDLTSVNGYLGKWSSVNTAFDDKVTSISA